LLQRYLKQLPEDLQEAHHRGGPVDKACLNKRGNDCFIKALSEKKNSKAFALL